MRKVLEETARMLLPFLLFSLALISPGAGRASSQPAPMWVQADALGPAWGLYPVTSPYGDTRPLGRYAAFASGSVGKLTWVADFPREAVYQVWVRRFVPRGGVAVTVDGEPVAGGRGGPGGVRYAWRHEGEARISAGSRHVDIVIDNAIFDAILFSADADFVPGDETLPDPVPDPVVRAPRRYRDDRELAAAAGAAGFVAAAVAPYEQHCNDILPAPGQVLERLEPWGAPGQYITGEFTVRSLSGHTAFRASLERLEGPGGHVIESGAIDLRVVFLRERTLRLFVSHPAVGAVPDLAVRDDRAADPGKGDQGGFGGGSAFCAIPAGESRHFILTVPVPGDYPAGTYRGNIEFRDGDEVIGALPVGIEALPVALEPVEGIYGAYYRAQPFDPGGRYHLPPDAFRDQLETMVRFGMNTTTLYGGRRAFEGALFAAEAGMTGAPLVMYIDVGEADARKQLGEAEQMGLAGLHWYGVDEPRREDRIALARQVAERRRRWDPPVGIMMAINHRGAYEALGDVVSHPVLNIKVFDLTSGAAREARERGFTPVSYWNTARDFPLSIRAFTGLYNSACGYLGTKPWAFYDAAVPGGQYDIIVPDGNGRSIPTLRLYAFRDGVDDVRYLQALDRAMEELAGAIARDPENGRLRELAETARAVRARHFESINESWHWYLCRLLPEEYGLARRAFAETAVLIDRVLAGSEN